MAQTQTADPDVLYCTVHPTIATNLRCNRCGRPMCTKCAVPTPVGYRCRECVRQQQDVYYTAQPFDPVVQLIVSVPLSAIAAGLIGGLLGALGLFFALLITIPVSTAAGALIADLAHRAVGKRRGRYGWLVVAAGIIIGALIVPILPGLFGLLTGAGLTLFLIAGFGSIGWWVYVVAGTIAAVGRLRLGR